MSATLSCDPILSIIVEVLTRLEQREVVYQELCMAAIVRNGYYIGLSYRSENTLVIWRSGSETVEFYNRSSGNLLEVVSTTLETAPIPSVILPGEIAPVSEMPLPH